MSSEEVMVPCPACAGHEPTAGEEVPCAVCQETNKQGQVPLKAALLAAEAVGVNLGIRSMQQNGIRPPTNMVLAALNLQQRAAAAVVEDRERTAIVEKEAEEQDKLRLCKGCRDDFYNGNNDLGVSRCWSFDTAQFTDRVFVSVHERPPHARRVERTLSCHRRVGFVAVKAGDPAFRWKS